MHIRKGVPFFGRDGELKKGKTKMDELNEKIDEIKKLMEEQLEVMNKTLEAITQSNNNIISELNRNRDAMVAGMRSINRGIGFMM